MRFKKIFGLIVGGLMLFSIALAGCNEESTVAGIDKEDMFTWFDMNKTDLPSLKKCKKIKEGMSLNQVIHEIGKPQRLVGSGRILFQFDLDNGSILTIDFDTDLEKIENNPDISFYDSLVVCDMWYGYEIPSTFPFFPYCGPFNKLEPWVNKLNVEDIVQVRYEHAFIGVAPGNFKDISYTTNSVDIENSYRLLFSYLQEIHYPDEGQVDGGSYVKYDFLTANNETYSVMVCNNIFDEYYKFVDNFYYKFEYADINCYSFDTNDISSVDQYEIYTCATESVKVGDYDGLGEFEFCINDGLSEKTPRYYLKTAFDVNLLILSSNQFMIEGEDNTVYQITSEKDFSSLFEDNN